MGQAAPDVIKPYFVDSAELSAGTCLYLSSPRARFLAGRYVDATWDIEVVEKNKDKIQGGDLLKTRVVLF